MKEYKIINPKQWPERAFYRVYILPRHVDAAKNAGNTAYAKTLSAELDEHLEWVKENKLDKQLKAYVGDQQARQDAYDKLAKLKGEFSVLRGTDMNRMETGELAKHAKALEKTVSDLEAAEAAFQAAKDNFKANWQSGPRAGIQKG